MQPDAGSTLRTASTTSNQQSKRVQLQQPEAVPGRVTNILVCAFDADLQGVRRGDAPLGVHAQQLLQQLQRPRRVRQFLLVRLHVANLFQ